MTRIFNTAGPCRPADHYMLPPERRLPGVRSLIDQKHSFVVHAPRQTGKTTALRALAERLTVEGRYAALPQSVALIGLRDVRDYRLETRPDAASLGTSSPFNVKVESLTLRDFTTEEVGELLSQHTEETGRGFAPEAWALVYELTRGQPWLMNALARQLVEVLVTNRREEITAEHVASVKEVLIQRRDTHLDSLVDPLREPRVKRVIEPILAGQFPRDEILDDDVQLVKDLGLVRSGSAGLEIANPIYREIIPRALTAVTEE